MRLWLPLRALASGFDVTILRLTNKRAPHTEPYPDAILPLTIDDIPTLRRSNRMLARDDEVVESLQAMPGLSHWHPASGEFVLVAPWRHRHDIPTFRIMSAFSNEYDLVSAALQAADNAGMSAFVTTETYEKRQPEFYASHGLDRLETIMAYHHARVQDYLDVQLEPRQEFRPLQIGDSDIADGMIALDHAAFPWVWRNSPEEFWWWMNQRSVEVTVGLIDGMVVSYYGTTNFRDMGHLDRIAIHPDYQGMSLGKETLSVALQRMARMGHKQAALSTQSSNLISQNLYHKAGFRHQDKNDYHMYGALLTAAPEEAK